MEQRALGSLQVSVIGLGCNNFGMMIDADATKAVVDAAFDAGINYFDTAESYGPRSVGGVPGPGPEGPPGRRAGGQQVGLRHQGQPGPARGHPGAAGGQPHPARHRLHRPLPAPSARPRTPQEETLGALAELKAEGKIREIGCTHFTAAELDDSVRAAGAKSVPGYPSVQNHYSLLTRGAETDGVFDACRRHGIAFVPYFPLESAC